MLSKRLSTILGAVILAVCLLISLGWMVMGTTKTVAASITSSSGGDSCFVETTGDNVTDFSSGDASALQTAVNAASPNDLIKIAGTCAGVSTTNSVIQTVHISKSLTLQGGYMETNWMAASDPVIYTTTLDAEGNGRVIYIDGNNDISLIGLTIIGGDHSGNGGGIYHHGTSLTISNTRVLSNTSVTHGGGIYTRDNDLSVFDSLFQNNEASAGNGGAIYSRNSLVSVTNSSFIENTASNGGAIYNQDGGQVTIQDSNLIDNHTLSGNGGGIYVENGEVNAVRTTLSGNSAARGGGIYVDSYGKLFLTNSTLSGNIAFTNGGGIFFSYVDGNEINYSTIYGNEAPNVGGIYLESAVKRPDISNDGVDLKGSIIAGNVGTDCGQTYDYLRDLGYNLIEDGSCITKVTSISGDPNLGALADNGGDTLTHALLSGSIAIDAGDPTYPVMADDYDQRGIGYDRVVNGRLDIGAYEDGPPPVCFVSVNNGNTTDYASADASAVQTAVDAATPNDLLKIAGTCAGVQTQNGLTQTVTINQDLTVQGGYDNNDWTAGSDPVANPTTLDAQSLGRVVVISETAVAQIENLIVTGGQAPDGGGIFVDTAATLTLNNSQVLSNTTAAGDGDFFSGGGLGNLGQTTINGTTFSYNHSINDAGGVGNGATGKLTIAGSTFSYNSASSDGGALASLGWVTVTNSIFTHNTANGAGAIGNLQALGGPGWMLIQQSDFLTNTAVVNGGAIDNDGGELHLIGSLFVGNSGKSGGAIYNNSSVSTFNPDLTVTDSTFLSNSTTNGDGGAIRQRAGTMTISGGTFAYNTASRSGGAIWVQNGSGNISNSTISGNTAVQDGGGIGHSQGNLEIAHGTIVGNMAAEGGGIHSSSGAPPLITNSILADNVNDNCASTGAAIVDGGYNLDSGNSCTFSAAGSISNTNPLLGPLADNGGSVAGSGQAMLTHALLLGSPAIDHILFLTNGCGTTYTTDQRGILRQNPNCDMGAYELWRLNIAIATPPNLTLTWPNAAAGCSYTVHENTTPYFALPGMTTYAGQASGNVYPQLGDVMTNYFYLVQTVCEGGATAVSNEVGEFDFAIVPGS